MGTKGNQNWLVIRLGIFAAWIYSCARLRPHIGDQFLQVYVIISIAVAIIFSLKYGGSKKRSRTANTVGEDGLPKRELSAYAFLNPGGERLASDLSLQAFGLRDANDGTGVVAQKAGTSAVNKPGSHLTEEQKIELSKCKLKRHQPCWCGSKKRFSTCCEGLHMELRELGYHVRQ